MAKIEVAEQVHAMLKQHCKEKRVTIKTFVSDLVTRELAPVEVRPRDHHKPRVFNSKPNDPWVEQPFWVKEK